MLEMTPNPLLNPTPAPARVGVGRIEAQMRAKPHLADDRRQETAGTRRAYRDARQAQTCAEAIGRLPGPDEAAHLIVSGRFALYHVIPAALKLAHVPIRNLTIATLGFSRDNIDGLCDLIDTARVGALWLLASHYFAGTSAPIYQHAAEQLARRPAARFYSCRTHAKVLAMQFADARTLTVESSANLRSCKNIESMTLIGDPAVYNFHRGWILELFQTAEAKGVK
jgi:hypothetical protein